MNHQVNTNSFVQAEIMPQHKADPLPNITQPRKRENHVVHVWSQWDERAGQFARAVEGVGATLFQSALWLETWYETFTSNSDINAVIVAVEDADTNELLLLLPLCQRMENGLSVICFPDFGLADYNAPLVHPDYAPGKKELVKLMGEILKALPDADLLKLEKIPDTIGKMNNPLMLMNGMHKSNLCHFGIGINGSWEDYWNSLKRSFRKDQRRRWRVLEKMGEASFIVCNDQQEIIPLFETLLVQQESRLQRLGLPYLLENLPMKQFYEKIIQRGCIDGPVIFTALLVDGQPVATLCGFGNGQHYTMTLSGNETGEWSKCSPGRLLTERTMQTLHENGYSYFDFSIGDEPYKKYFAIEQGTLNEYVHPLSYKALLRYSWIKIKARHRKSHLVQSVKNKIFRN
jgi:CelD/BcsL family acetyltransferase involved in cellulose biosynthesis